MTPIVRAKQGFLLVELVIALHDEDRLCQHSDHDEIQEPVLICSMGLKEA